MRAGLVPILLFCLPTHAAPSIQPGPEFLRYWKSGLAELSSYEVSVERYGELRNGQAVLIFVYEETDADTRIKVESGRTPRERRIPVLKMNHALKFTTGIYDYSIMTSVFSGLSGPFVNRPFEPVKISFSSQEWCGNVYQQLLPRSVGLVSEIRSYFEAEGDAEDTLPYPDKPMYYEDEMPILVRELDGPILKAGESMRVGLVPGLWERRKRHVALTLGDAVLAKSGPGSRTWRGRTIPIVKWTLSTRSDTTAYFVETAHPRKLLGWENSRGEKGGLIGSVRKPYWTLNRGKDTPLRDELGLDYGVRDGK